MSGLDLNTYYGKISELARKMNKAENEREGMNLLTAKNLSKVHLKKKEPIEYVVKPEEEQELEM